MRTIEAVAGVLRRGDTFLAVERPQGKIMAGYWEFPGGKIEPGETPREALRRELAEELGIACSEATLWQTARHRYEHGVVVLRLFHVSLFTGEPEPLEGQRLLWVTPAEALAMPFLPADVPLVKQLAIDLKMCDAKDSMHQYRKHAEQAHGAGSPESLCTLQPGNDHP